MAVCGRRLDVTAHVHYVCELSDGHRGAHQSSGPPATPWLMIWPKTADDRRSRNTKGR